jgi:uncharacterized protein YnzC (UPF0291/DUF896 family)
MNITALINHHNVHNSPSAERFYRLQLSRNGRTPTELTRRHKAADLTRDEKVEIRALRRHAKWPYSRIVEATGKTFQQVQDACSGPLTPQKVGRTGRKVLIRTPEKEILMQYLRTDVLYRELQLPALPLRMSNWHYDLGQETGNMSSSVTRPGLQIRICGRGGLQGTARRIRIPGL